MMRSERRDRVEEDVTQTPSGALAARIRSGSGENPYLCYLCKKCSTGCPVAQFGDVHPAQVVRAVQLGDEAMSVGSRFIWLCTGCETCTTRCPMEIDIAAVMDALRIMAIDRQVALPDAHGREFNRSFLGSVRHHGRVFEMGMMAAYKLRTFDLLTDVGKVPQMLAKGKLSLLPNRSGSAKEVREIFNRLWGQPDR